MESKITNILKNLKNVFLILLLICSSDILAQVPGAPINLVATPINTGGMIQFTTPSSVGGSAITNYQYSTDNGATWVTPSPAVTESPLIISSGLTNCTTYQIKLRAVNASGSGSPSAAINVTPTASALGVNWTSRSSAQDLSYNGIAYGNGLFVAIRSYDYTLMTSPDGINWGMTAANAMAGKGWTGITFGNGLFVAVAAGSGTNSPGNCVMTSPDGINWTSRTSAADNTWWSVTYGNGIFVAVSSTGTYQVMTSPDGITWTPRSAPTL